MAVVAEAVVVAVVAVLTLLLVMYSEFIVIMAV